MRFCHLLAALVACALFFHDLWLVGFVFMTVYSSVVALAVWACKADREARMHRSLCRHLSGEYKRVRR